MLIQFLAEARPDGLADPTIADLALPELQVCACLRIHTTLWSPCEAGSTVYNLVRLPICQIAAVFASSMCTYALTVCQGDQFVITPQDACHA